MTLNGGGHTSDCVSTLLRQTCPLNFIAIVTSALGGEADLHALNNIAASVGEHLNVCQKPITPSRMKGTKILFRLLFS